MFSLRPEQQTAVDFAIDNPRCGLVLPTAFGKTYIAKALADSFKGRTLIITVSNELVKQFIQVFDTPYLIGKKHYRKQDYEEMKDKVANAQIAVTNPAAFHYHKNGLFAEFDNIILDEADSCLGLLKLQVCKSYGCYHKEMNALQVYDTIKVYDEMSAEYFIKSQQFKFWKIEETEDSEKRKRKEPYTLRVYDIMFNGPLYFEPYKRVVLMSGTLFSSDIRELLESNIPTYEAPSPIPVERRSILGFTDNGESYSPDDPEELARLILKVLDTHTERPAVVHTTYKLAPLIGVNLLDSDVSFYTEKEEKIDALLAIEGTGKTLLASGAQIGLDLKGDKCRLNILLNGFFPNLGDMYVQKRKAVIGGEKWYCEAVLRLVIQACGRSTRSIDDHSKVFLCDTRVIRLIKQRKDELPKYFVEACEFLA